MKGSTLIKIFLVLLLIGGSLYTLWPTFKSYTTADKEKKASYKKDTIKLGLDLQGGMYLTYEIDLPDLFTQISERKNIELNEIMSEVKAELNVRPEDFFVLLTEAFKKRELKLNKYWGEEGESDELVISTMEKQAEDALDRAMQKLRNRVDQFGVSEPTLQKIGSRRILIELPGVKDQEGAKELIGKTAVLEFCIVKDQQTLVNTIKQIDQAVSAERKGILPDEMVVVTEDTSKAEKKESKDETVPVSELFGEREPEETGAEPAKPDSSRLLVDAERFEENPFIALLRNSPGRDLMVPVENIPAIKRILASNSIQPILPRDAVFRWGSEDIDVADKKYRELYLVDKTVALVGTHVTDARVGVGTELKTQGKPVVSFTLDSKGRRIFSDVTEVHIQERLAIILDSLVVSAPVIQTKIPDGSGQITGIATEEEAKMISIVLRVGALPAPLRIIESREVGPSLGKDSIESSKIATIIGFTLIVMCMFIYYRGSGLIADLAMILNILFLMAALTMFGFTLTLPGIAGIILTMGMAVDANVLIYERIREELRTGKTVRASIDQGYSNAFRAIFDSNLTTLLTAVVLYKLGTGPIRGFAVTLSIGIVVSMFTAIVVTRLIYDIMTSRKVMTRLSI
jgi:SecD/SecF fusion protein